MFLSYERALARRPLFVKTATGMLLGVSGDYTAQRLEGGTSYDSRRGLAFGSLATIWNGPCIHYLFGWLERHLPRSGGVRTLVPKMLVTQLLVNPFGYLPLFYTWTGAVLDRTPAQTLEKARREYWVTLKATWIFFVPFNVVNFSLVPVRHQAATLAAFSFFYATTISAIANAEQSGGGWALDLLLGPRAKPPGLRGLRLLETSAINNNTIHSTFVPVP